MPSLYVRRDRPSSLEDYSSRKDAEACGGAWLTRTQGYGGNRRHGRLRIRKLKGYIQCLRTEGKGLEERRKIKAPRIVVANRLGYRWDPQFCGRRLERPIHSIRRFLMSFLIGPRVVAPVALVGSRAHRFERPFHSSGRSIRVPLNSSFSGEFSDEFFESATLVCHVFSRFSTCFRIKKRHHFHTSPCMVQSYYSAAPGNPSAT